MPLLRRWRPAVIQVAVITAVYLLLGASPARAGADCEPEQGWSLLETLAKGEVLAKDLGPGNNDVDLCLLGPRSLMPWQRHWYRKGPKVEAAKVSKDGLKIARLCAPAFGSPKRELAQELCVALLAAEGVAEIAGQPTLARGSEIFECGFPLKQLPRLPGSASARAAEAQWNQEEETHCGYGNCRCERAPKLSKKKRRMKRRAKFLRDHKLDVLNALSYVGDAQSIRWLEDVASKDTDSEVSARAKKVLAILRPEPQAATR